MNAPAAPHATPVTSAADGRCHRGADDAYTAGPAARSGRYTELCGHRVVAALACPPGPDCRSCAAAAAVTPPPIGRGRHRGAAR